MTAAHVAGHVVASIIIAGVFLALYRAGGVAWRWSIIVPCLAGMTNLAVMLTVGPGREASLAAVVWVTITVGFLLRLAPRG
jgi:hypothetical protein